MGCGCGSRSAYTVDPRRGSVGSWSVIYPHGAVRPFVTESAARSFIGNRSDADRYTLVDPDGTYVPI
jgi:hypothetical protein